MKYTIAFIVASLAVLTAKNLKLDKESEPETTEELDSVEDRIYWIDSKDVKPVPFDFKGTVRRDLALYAALTDPSRNLICSPISALLPLGKLVLGTESGASRDELLNAIGYTKNTVKSGLRSIINKLKYLPGVTLSLASTLYVSKNKELLSKYQRDTVSVFRSTIQKVDFGSPVETATFINQKVFDGTNGKIKEIVKPGDISPSASLILVNAIYFAGLWKDPFQSVYLGDFHTPAGLKKVPMMARSGDYKYVKSDILDAQILELPYEGKKASFIIVLPVAQNSLTLLLRELKVAPEMLNRAISRMSERKVLVQMPKFRIESELNLNVLYEKIGVKHVFNNEKSGLTRILHNNKPWVSRAVQKVYIEVTEKGTEAAAVTGLFTSLSYIEPVKLRVDRPFLFFIKAGDIQLFAGIFTGQSSNY